MLKHWRGNLTLEGVGRQLGGKGWMGKGEEREKEMHTTPLLFKNIYIIDKAWLLQGGATTHRSSISQGKQTHWQLYPNQFTERPNTLVQDKASTEKIAIRGNKKRMQHRR